MVDVYTIKCMGIDPVSGSVKTDIIRGDFDACGQTMCYYDRHSPCFAVSFVGGKEIGDVYMCFEQGELLQLATYDKAVKFIKQHEGEKPKTIDVDKHKMAHQLNEAIKALTNLKETSLKEGGDEYATHK